MRLVQVIDKALDEAHSRADGRQQDSFRDVAGKWNTGKRPILRSAVTLSHVPYAAGFVSGFAKGLYDLLPHKD